MSLIAAVDPGVTTGYCLIDTTQGLQWADALAHDDRHAWLKFRGASSSIVEKPMIYPVSKARPADIITLAVRAGEAGGRFAAINIPTRYVLPHEWKRSMPKNICHARILSKLTDTEKAVWRDLDRLPESKRHNAYDAVGIALFATGRTVF